MDVIRKNSISPEPLCDGDQIKLGGLVPRFGLVVLGLAFIPWRSLVVLAMTDDRYSHIPIIPVIAGATLYWDRKQIFRGNCYWSPAALPLIAIALLGSLMQRTTLWSLPETYLLFGQTCMGILATFGTFLFSFGFSTFRRASFSMLLLLLMIPETASVINPVIRMLQEGSAIFSAFLFQLIHLPTFRQDLIFSLPGFDIKIAEQCSGIRSSIALFITSLLAAHLFLRQFWRKLTLVLLTIPLVIFKNALRIVTITALGFYVNPGFLHGRLHRYSGVPFSLVELAIIVPLVARWHALDSMKLRNRDRKGASGSVMKPEMHPKCL